MLTQEYIKSILAYNPDTGAFTWKVAISRSLKIGDVAGNLNLDGYVRIRINKKQYPAHKLAWLYMYGEFPAEQIDHINHDRSDNRIANLRVVSHQENHRNRTIPINNTSGHVGVFWDKHANKWRARIKANNKVIYLGYFINITDAVASRKQAEIKYNFHPNHGDNRK